jgi:hypothetical protein
MLHDPFEDLEPPDSKFVQDSIVQLGLPPVPATWNTDGESSHRLLPLELVLAHTPNLEYLRIPLDYDWELPILTQLLLPPTPNTKFSLPHLHSLQIHHHYTSGDRFSIPITTVETLLHAAPNLTSLCLPSPHSDYRSNNTPTPPLNNLRHLYFQGNCTIDPDLLTNLLASAPNLAALRLHWDALGDSYAWCDGRRVTDAWDAIAGRRDSLREVRLDVRVDTQVGDVGVGGRGSLGDFRRLEVLMVDGHALGALRAGWVRDNRGLGGRGGGRGVDGFLEGLFPLSIRRVTFWNLDGVEMRDAMLRFARAVADGRYPRLEEVVLAPSETSDRRGFDEWHNAGEWNVVKDELEEDFRKGGVRFELRWKSPYWSGSRLE